MGETAKDVRLHVTLDDGEHLFLPGEAVTLDAGKADALSQQALRYEQFIAPLIKAVQEQQAQIEALKAEIAVLKAGV